MPTLTELYQAEAAIRRCRRDRLALERHYRSQRAAAKLALAAAYATRERILRALIADEPNMAKLARAAGLTRERIRQLVDDRERREIAPDMDPSPSDAA